MRSVVFLRALVAACLAAACGGTDTSVLDGPATVGKGGSAGGGGKVCTYGETQVCVGPAACKGGQSCLVNGTGWTPCDCGFAGAGGATGGTTGGTGASSGTGGAAGTTAGAAGTGGDAGTAGSGTGGAGGDPTGTGGAAGDGGMGGDAGAGGTGGGGAGGTGGSAGTGGSGPVATWSVGLACSGVAIRFVATDPQANVVVVGTLTDNCTIGTTPVSGGAGTALLVAKLDPNGVVLWVKAFGDGSSVDTIGGLAIDANGNIALVGSAQGTLDFGKGPLASFGSRDAFVAKLGPDGAAAWANSYGNTAVDTAEGVAFDENGNVVVIGLHTGKADFGNTSVDGGSTPELFAAKLGPDGGTLWAEGFYGASTAPLGIGTKAGGHVVVAGGFRTDVSFGGGPIFTAQAPGSGRTDLFVAELDANGKHVWSHAFGDADGNQTATALAVTSAGGIVLTGVFDGTLDFGPQKLTGPAFTTAAFAAAFSPIGAFQWGLAWGEAGGTVTPGGVAVGPTGTTTLAGAFTSSITFGGPTLSTTGGASATYYARLDPSGAHLQSAAWPGSAGTCVAVAATGATLLGGSYSGAVDFGAGTLPIGSGSYVVKLPPLRAMPRSS